MMASERIFGEGESADKNAPIRDYVSKIEDKIVPYWSKIGFDRSRRAFVERLDFSGQAIAGLPRRAMVQARQIYVFCEAARRSDCSDYGDSALSAIGALVEHYCAEGDPSYGFAFSISDEGTIVSAKRDSYTHAFILFAFASAFRLTGERRYRLLASKIDGFIQSRLMDPEHGGLFVEAELHSGDKLQNPLMHLLEAYLAMAEALDSEEYLEKCGKIIELFDKQMYRRDLRILPERYACDWSPAIESEGYFEPGHHFEWIWLLYRFDRMTRSDHSIIANEMWRTACESGLNHATHCHDEVGFDYKPRIKSTRLWPHAEGAKAAVVRLDKDPTAPHILQSMIIALNETFLCKPFAEGWLDHFDQEGSPLVNYVPASSLYHLYVAYTEVAPLVLRLGYEETKMKNSLLEALGQ